MANRKNNFIFLSTFLLFLIILESCASVSTPLQIYPGTKLPKDKTATITRWNENAGILCYICIRGIDGKKRGDETRRVASYEVMPGKHRLTIGLHRLNRTEAGWDSERAIDFDAKAGRDYAIDYKEEGEEIILFIKDITK